jgi:hypothetical protein
MKKANDEEKDDGADDKEQPPQVIDTAGLRAGGV